MNEILPSCIHIDRNGERCERRRWHEMDMCEKHTRRFIHSAVLYGRISDEALMELRRDAAEYFMFRYKMTTGGLDPEQVRAARREESARRKAEYEAHVQERSVVYYVRRGGGRIKIGTTVDLRDRMETLYATDDDLLATEPGGYEVEQQRHREFAHLRVGKRELFEYGDDLRRHVESIRGRFGEPRIAPRVSRAEFEDGRYGYGSPGSRRARLHREAMGRLGSSSQRGDGAPDQGVA